MSSKIISHIICWIPATVLESMLSSEQHPFPFRCMQLFFFIELLQPFCKSLFFNSHFHLLLFQKLKATQKT